METELLEVLYDYEYDYKEKKISIVCNEKLKLLQRTNQHWWKVVRPGVNKAFFVPAQYVQTVSRAQTSSKSKQENDSLAVDAELEFEHVQRQHQRQESTSSNGPKASPENSTMNNNYDTSISDPKDRMANNGVKMKRTDSSRASKRAMKVKNWSASLEELSKQIVFPGLAAESVMNLSTTGVCSRNQPRSTTTTTNTNSKTSKPVPLPRKSSSDAVSVPIVIAGSTETYSTPKPIPKARSKNVICDSSNSNKSSGGSSEILTSNEDLLITGTANVSVSTSSCLLRDNYKDSPSQSPQDMKSLATTAATSTLSTSTSTSLTELGKPSPPTKDNKPIRLLLDNWAEYLTSEKRLFYFNDITGATSWKPPRVNSIRHDSSFEDTTTTTTSTSPSFLGTEVENNNVSGSSPIPSLSLTEDAQLQLPEGWSCSLDEGSGQFCYVNQGSGARWFSSQDPQGKIYYYEENSNKSSWFLPVPGIILNEDHNSSSPLSKSTTSDSLEVREGTPPKLAPGMPDLVNLVKKRHSTGDVADRFLKARSLVILDPNRKSSELVNVKNASLPRSPNSRSIWNTSVSGVLFSVTDSEVLVLKEGSLSRTKITENGKKVRKNWSTIFVVLTEEHLSLFKDQKSFTNATSRKAEIEIELVGASVEWSEDKSSRKNVFQLNTCQGLQILFQTDERKLAEDWIEALDEVIGAQIKPDFTLRLCSTSPDTFVDNPVGEKKGRLGRVKSTKVKITGSVENLSEEKGRIKAQLKKFFNRRPPRESLVKKGIWKDESVFGCHLEKLCSREETLVPRFVQECIAAIESKVENLKTDGIYRASGNLSQVQKIRFQVDQNNLTCLYQEEDVHVLAGSLKLFFREMKEPLIPSNLFQKALEASNMQNKKDKLSCFHDIVSRLDKPNKATLHVLLRHLLKVSEYAEFNRMLIPNLAIVFGPTLMWPAQESTNMALDLMQQNLVIEALLLDFNSIFER